MNRRHFIATTSTAFFAARSQAAAADGFIDAHVHVWPKHTEDFPLAEGFKPEDMQPPSFTPEQLFAHTKPEGVSRIVLIQMSYYRFDNSYMLKVMADHPGVFGGVAIVDESEADVAATMLKLKDKGVRGFRIYTSGSNYNAWLGSKGMETMWTTAAAEGLAICPLINPDALPFIDTMCSKHPDTTVVIDHFARIGMRSPPTEDQLKPLLALAKHPRVHVKTSAFYALGKKQPPYTDLAPMIKSCVDAFGASRLMWASDCPFQVDPGHDYKSSISLVRDGLDFLTPDDRTQMLRGTAERLFFS